MADLEEAKNQQLKDSNTKAAEIKRKMEELQKQQNELLAEQAEKEKKAKEAAEALLKK